MSPELAKVVADHKASRTKVTGICDNKFTPERLRDTLFEQIRRICLHPPTDPALDLSSLQALAALAAAINKSIENEWQAKKLVSPRETE